jgi:hypothetical protein
MSTKITTEGPPQGESPNVGIPASHIPARLRIAGILLRALFIAVLLAVTVRVSSPQSENIWTVYETPGDLIRLALGFGVCLWVLFHLFVLPKDAEGYRTWIYLGLIVAPFALTLAFAIW